MLKTNLESIDNSLKGYNLSLWELGKDNIPTFAYDIKDLSGNGNHALDLSVSKSSEGITTSTKDAKGWVNMGLINYDFGNTLTYVVRVKFADIETTQEFFGNWQSAGGGITIKEGKLVFN